MMGKRCYCTESFMYPTDIGVYKLCYFFQVKGIIQAQLSQETSIPKSFISEVFVGNKFLAGRSASWKAISERMSACQLRRKPVQDSCQKSIGEQLSLV